MAPRRLRSAGFVLYFLMAKITFLVDGFNLYHSLREASDDLGLSKQGTRWLDLKSLCSSYLRLFGKSAVLSEIYYFSALAHHLRDANNVTKHRQYIQCLEATGVIVELGKFKDKYIDCRLCGGTFKSAEEKETDVAIAVKLLELAVTRSADVFVLVTGDTDIAPAIRAVKRLYPTIGVCCGFPYGRKTKELNKLTDNSFKLTSNAYLMHQFSDPFSDGSGLSIPKPQGW